MTLPTLESMEAELDSNVMAALGDAISYTPSGSSALSIRAHVDYEDGEIAVGGAEAIQPDISVEILKSDLPSRPVSADRITLSKVPGKTFRPVNVSTDKSGTHWLADLREVPGG